MRKPCARTHTIHTYKTHTRYPPVFLVSGLRAVRSVRAVQAGARRSYTGLFLFLRRLCDTFLLALVTSLQRSFHQPVKFNITLFISTYQGHALFA